jgi:plastocyanin
MRKILLVILSVIMMGAGGVALETNNSWLASPKAAAQGQAQSVSIQNFAFSPATLNVIPGTTVTWTNNDSTAHTVTVNSGNGPNSGQLQHGQTYSFTFSQAGTFAYHCNIHPQMKATVVVASSTPAPSTTSQPPKMTPPSGSTSQQQHTQTMPSGGGMGAGEAAPQPAAPSEVGGQGGQVATGPVETGAGSLAATRHQNEMIALLIGGLSIIAATTLLATRLVTRRVFSRSSSR